LEGCEILVLDASGNRLGFNQVGEIAVRSRYLSPGYWRMPELTNVTFLSDPEGSDTRIFRTGDLGCMLPDGCLLHRGRKNSHVKIRGYSVELAEIEAALIEIDAVRETVVTTKDNAEGNQALVAYIVPADKSALTISVVRDALAARLPDYMIPTAFVFLDSLPLAGPGKVNLRALPEPGRARPDLDICVTPPRTPIEEKIAGIWAEVLHVDQVGIHDRFLDLGGDSLIAARIISRILAEFKIELPLRSLFDTPTVADMAAVLVQNDLTPVRPKEVERVLPEAGGF
jgi:acyl carrier protein